MQGSAPIFSRKICESFENKRVRTPRCGEKPFGLGFDGLFLNAINSTKN